MQVERCHTCDRPKATDEDWKKIPEGQGEHLCWEVPCRDTPVDWRARALVAEAVADEATCCEKCIVCERWIGAGRNHDDGCRVLTYELAKERREMAK